MINWKSIFTYVILSVAAFVSLFPFIWMLISMTNKSVRYYSGELNARKQLALRT